MQTFEMGVGRRHQEPQKTSTCDNLTKKQRKTKNNVNLPTREDLIIKQADEGGGTVIWSFSEYIKEVNNQLQGILP